MIAIYPSEISRFSITDFRLLGSFVSHSQITTTFHPSFLSSALTRASRALLVANLAIQYGVRGGVALPQPGCWCQKQPCIKTAICRRGSTKSGVPGRSRRCNRNRRPRAWAARLTRSSGVVFLPPTRDINHDRLCGVSRSVKYCVAAVCRKMAGSPSA